MRACYLYNYLMPRWTPSREEVATRSKWNSFQVSSHRVISLSTTNHQKLENLLPQPQNKTRWTWLSWPLFPVPLSQLEKFPLVGLGNQAHRGHTLSQRVIPSKPVNLGVPHLGHTIDRIVPSIFRENYSEPRVTATNPTFINCNYPLSFFSFQVSIIFFVWWR